jgi:hypothetical protein
MKEYDKKTIENIKAEDDPAVQPCGKFNPKVFDAYQLGTISEDMFQALTQHTQQCTACRVYLHRTNRIMEASKTIANQYPDEPLLLKLRNFIDQEYSAGPHFVALAADTTKLGFGGNALGVAVAAGSGHGKIIKCKAFVQGKERQKGSLKILGLKGDRGILDYLEDKFETIIFPSCLDCRAHNIDRRVIGVDLDENLFRTADSLSLSIMMAIFNAIQPWNNDDRYLYSADIERFGKLIPVARVQEKIEIAFESGLRQFVFSKENQTDVPVKYLKDPELTFLFF